MRVCQKNNKSNYTLDDACEHPILSLNLYGKSMQDGIPTPETPVDIVSVGDDGNVNVTACGKNLLDIKKITPIQVEKITINGDNIVISAGNYIYGVKMVDESLLKIGTTYTFSVESISSYGTTKFGWRIPYTDGTYASNVSESLTLTVTIEKPARGVWFYVRMGEETTDDIVISKPQLEIGSVATKYESYTGSTATITSGLPLCSVGEYRDELIYNADGTSKIIKRTANLNSYNGEEITTDFISSTGGLDLGATIVYVLATPQKIELSAAEMAELSKLNTFIGHTEIFNSGNAVMDVKYLGGYNEQAQTIGFWNSRKE